MTVLTFRGRCVIIRPPTVYLARNIWPEPSWPPLHFALMERLWEAVSVIREKSYVDSYNRIKNPERMWRGGLSLSTERGQILPVLIRY